MSWLLVDILAALCRHGAVMLQIQILDIGYDTGEDRLLLWLPVTIKHTINAVSPLASWANMSGFLADADSCIAVTVRLCCSRCSRLQLVTAVIKSIMQASFSNISIAMQVEGYMYANAQNRMRMRVYNCFNDIKVSTCNSSALQASSLQSCACECA